VVPVEAPLQVRADPVMLTQVILNLLANALDALGDAARST
jgi:C4-dicarboxylate-specific signal transduction histidine kinase